MDIKFKHPSCIFLYYILDRHCHVWHPITSEFYWIMLIFCNMMLLLFCWHEWTVWGRKLLPVLSLPTSNPI
jgi:hypothetical protein